MTTDPADPDHIEYLPMPHLGRPIHRLHRAEECAAKVESLRTQLAEVTRTRDAVEMALAGLALDVSLPLPGVTEVLSPEEIRARVAARLAEVTRERNEAQQRIGAECNEHMKTMAERDEAIAARERIVASHNTLAKTWIRERDAAEARLAVALTVVEAAKAWRAAHASGVAWSTFRDAQRAFDDAVDVYHQLPTALPPHQEA